MQHDPNERTNPMGDSLERERGSQRQSAGAAMNNLDADLGDTTGDRSAGAFSDTSGTLGRESLGGGSERFERKAEDMKESAREKFDATKESAREKLNATREKASNLKSTLADKLEQGAEKLRHKADTTTMTEVGADTERKARKASDKVAAGMENTAQWLRTADVDSMKSGLESQVRSNPGRTLLVALGLGYVVGRMFRGGRGS
jgi:flagellar biosynthesis GTPase FlhF